MIYLDYAAHTTTSADIFSLMNEINKKYILTPNSDNILGKMAKEQFDFEIKSILDMLKLTEHDLIPTSSATEANNLALKGVASMYASMGKHIICSPIEHSSIDGSISYLKESGFEIDYLKLDSFGKVDLLHLVSLLRADTILVTVAGVNSEAGIIQPIKELAKIIHSKSNAIFHCDATQAVGKIDIDFNSCDLISLTGHKLFGLTSGSAALLRRKTIMLRGLIDGGKSTTPFRSSTPDLASLCALTLCIRKHIEDIDKHYEYTSKLRDILIDFFSSFPDILINSCENPYIINISTSMNGEALKIALANEDVYVSTKSACVAKSVVPKTVYEMFHDRKRAKNSIRISLSYKTTKEDILEFTKIFERVYKNG